MNSQFWSTPGEIIVRWVAFLPVFIIVVMVATFIARFMAEMYKPEVYAMIEETGTFGDYYINGPLLMLVLTIVPFTMAIFLSSIVCPNPDIGYGVSVAICLALLGISIYLLVVRDLPTGKVSSIVVQMVGLLISLAMSRQQIQDIVGNTKGGI
ncbi:MAG: hypothetical protein JNL13_07815 [Chitinophagaceae bacterium]|nr:hypothetical protein [Chitinophagaceae bacterium]